MTKHSSWDTESGLLDDFDFEVDDAWFGEDEESDNNDGRIFLFLRGEATDDEGEVYEDHRERYSTGKNWEVVDDGAEVENAGGKTRFNQNAGIGRLINALVALGDDVAEYLQGRGAAFEAATFEGLNMHMDNKVVSKWTNDDGEEVEWRLNLPSELTIPKPKKGKKKGGGKGKAGRGKVEDKKASKASKTTKSKKSKKSSTSSLRSEVAEFASQFDKDEYDTFLDEVLDSDVFPNADQILDDDDLHADVLDEDSDLWKDAH